MGKAEIWYKKLKLFSLMLLAIGLLSFPLSGCGKGSAPPSHDGSQASTGLDSDKKLSEIYDIDRIIELEPIKVRIVNVGVVKFIDPAEDRKGQIAIGLEIANTSDKTVSYFPEQITLSTPAGKNYSADGSISSDLGGSYPPKRVMKGFVIFPFSESDQEGFSILNIKFPAPQSQENKPLGEQLKINIDLKQAEVAH